MKKILLLFVLMTMTLVLVAQNYSPCYTNNMAKGEEAFKQGKYSEAKAFYSTAKQCPNGNSTEVQNKIDVCETRIEAQLKEAEKESEKESAVKIRHTGKVKVSNVTAVQVGGEIHVSYDLEKQSDITIFLSVDGGKTFQQLNNVSGDVGEDVTAGHKTIVWDVLAEREQLKGDDIMFKVKAQGGDNLELVVNGVTFKMIYVKGGSFTMGCTSEQGSDCYDGERPAHSVTLGDFYMGETEVTQALWKAVMGSNPSWFKGDNLPVENVSWNDCQEFIRRLNQQTGKTFRLPTEAEWEYAARGGQKSQGYKYSGSNNINEVAWYYKNSGDRYIDKWAKNWRSRDNQGEKNHLRSHPVKEKQPNELGLYDMSGNVSEWCQDWYLYEYYRISPSVCPSGPSFGSDHVLRGGSWTLDAVIPSYRDCQVIYRRCGQGYSKDYGLRLLLVPDEMAEWNGLNDNIIVFDSTAQDGDIVEFTINGLAFKMVFVQGGTFSMGCTPEQMDDCDGDEKLVHIVTLSDFYMGETEVTQVLWEAVMGTTAKAQRNKGNPNREMKGEGIDYPIYYVSYYEAKTFCDKLNILLQKKLPNGCLFSLPTEAQWEYAARGGNKSEGYKYAGGNTINEVSAYYVNPVKSRHPNELGLYDMSGNVWEWCSDWYGSYSNSAQTNPSGPSSGYAHVLRGGAWAHDKHKRVTARKYYTEEELWQYAIGPGFRLSLVQQ